MDPAFDTSVSVDFLFRGEKPTFADLHMIRGWEIEEFPPSGRFKFEQLADFGFDQVDDYYGITSFEDIGDDVVVWLYPLIDNDAVYHDPGPYTGLRLDYSVLRNPVEKNSLFLSIVNSFATVLETDVIYENSNLGNPPKLEGLAADMQAIVDYWKAKGVEVGSQSALRIPR